MSILSNFAAEPNRLELLVDFLKSEKKGYTKTELEDLFSPPSGRGKSSVFKEVYTVADSLAVFEFKEQENGSDLIFLKTDLRKKLLVGHIEDMIFKKEFSLKDKFAYAISWILLQDPKYPIDWSDNISSRVSKDLNNEFGELELTNKERFQHFIYWCQYLGFIQKVAINANTYVIPDPTNAIERHMQSVFNAQKEMRFEDFLYRLAEALPVMEYGWIRDSIEEKARDGLQRNVESVSTSTSLALLRLEERGIIQLLSKSDADVISLSGIANKRITHIQYLGGK